MATFSRPGVFIQEVELPQTIELAEGGAAIGAFVGALAKGPTNVPVLLSTWAQFTKTFGNLQDAYPTTWAAYNFFANGGRQLYVKRVTGANAAAASVMLTDRSSSHLNTILVQAANAGTWGNNLAVQIRAAGSASRFGIAVYGSPINVGNPTSNYLEGYTDLSMDKTDPRYFASVINSSSPYIHVFDQNSASTPNDNMPVVGSLLYALGSTTAGADGDAPTRSNYAAGLSSFDPIQTPLVFNIPALGYLYTPTGSNNDRTNVLDITSDLVAYCASRGDAFAVLDTPSGLAVSEAQAFAADLSSEFAASSTGDVAAIYYPWYLIPDTLRASRGATRLQAPGAGVVGQFLATDASRGVQKTPAGLQNRIALAVDTEHQFTNAELDALNTGVDPINPIRNVPGAGIVIMGGRTLDNSAGKRYINIRRSLTYIEKELKDRIAFAVFENNDSRLWDQIRTVCSSFLGAYWQQGGLRGATPIQAYFVKCDSTTTTDADILNGQINIEIGVALEYPAEFIVIKLGQITGSATA
jgi:hypothetical protein